MFTDVARDERKHDVLFCCKRVFSQSGYRRCVDVLTFAPKN